MRRRDHTKQEIGTIQRLFESSARFWTANFTYITRTIRCNDQSQQPMRSKFSPLSVLMLYAKHLPESLTQNSRHLTFHNESFVYSSDYIYNHPINPAAMIKTATRNIFTLLNRRNCKRSSTDDKLRNEFLKHKSVTGSDCVSLLESL